VKEVFEELQGKGLLIHHWDTDGICSARLLLEELKGKDVENKTPILGNYYLTKEELKLYSKYAFIIIADMSLPEENIQKLRNSTKVIIFDHHLGKLIKEIDHHNPIIKGEDPDKYPSASWIVNDYLGNEDNIFALLGIIGDHEQKIKENSEFYEKINKFCKNHNITFEDMLKMAYLLDTNYKIGDKDAVEEAPKILFNVNSPKDILDNTSWNENYKKINNEIESILLEPNEDINGLILRKINTPFNIISTITRKISWETGKNTVVINTGFFDDKDQIYMRSLKNAEPMIKRGKEMGYKCGGKKEVMGAIVPKDETDSFVIEIIDFLK
jgi:single-stranded DNA-specific DHH superfamily exonuclease